MLFSPSTSALNSSTRWRKRARSFSSISADKRLEHGERAAQRKQDQRQVARRRRVRRLDQRIVDRRDFLLRLLLRDVGGNRLRPGLPSPPRLVRRRASVGHGRPPLRELGIHHQDAGRHEALACIRRRGQAAQQLLLAGNHVEPGGDEIVELLQVAPQTRSPPLRSRPEAPCRAWRLSARRAAPRGAPSRRRRQPRPRCAGPCWSPPAPTARRRRPARPGGTAAGMRAPTAPGPS